ncbi:C2H2-type zinc finger protein [Senna tora]|uniref:C2H2-type zinc finger protein n=1 Tax=Senna tora TaxID=362788 RepID=A0A834TJU1_9FABA|nr:C2H2-type zinc finger protein [Senna tora]
MIKRRFYKIDHADRGNASDSSSSSSDFEPEAEETEESEEHTIPEVNGDDESGSTSSGYKSEDSSANDVDVNSSDDVETSNERKVPINHTNELLNKHDSEVSERKADIVDENESLPADVPTHVLKCKSVFKCRICPRIICLTEDTLRAHLQSKRHARSEKLLSEGRLKAMLNSDGELENQEKQHKKRQRKKVKISSPQNKAYNTSDEKVQMKWRKYGKNISNLMQVFSISIWTLDLY